MNRKLKAEQFLDEGYNITVMGRNVAVTDALKDYAIEKVSKMKRFTDHIIDAAITMDHQKLEHRIDIVLKVNHTMIKSHAVSDNMYASIDKAVDKLEAQLLKYKNKLQDHHGKDVSSVDMVVNVLRPIPDEEIIDFNESIEKGNLDRLSDKYIPHYIVSHEKLSLKTLTDGEALMKMTLSGDVFLIYREEISHRLKVMYRRHDGNFGVIEPELS